MLQDWQQRVVEEKKELDEKIEKLKKFLKGIREGTLPVAVTDSIGDYDRDLLIDQLSAMKDYSECLRYRIDLFNR